MWTGNPPNVSHLRAYGCKIYVRMEKRDRKGKMGPLTWIGVNVGFKDSSYRVWDPTTNVVSNVGAGHADFDESVPSEW